jgi:hypothetical protein
MVPLHLQQWLLDHTSCGESKFFQHKEKIIFFTKDIVDKVFGFPLGTKPFVMDSCDPDIIIEVEQLHAQYKQGRKTIPVKVLVSILLGTNSEEVFIRSFILFFITTVLCPSTYNFVNPKYLYCLRDIDIPEVGNLDFGTLCLNHLWYEMDAWKDKIFMNTGDFNRLTWIGGCLPLLAVCLSHSKLLCHSKLIIDRFWFLRFNLFFFYFCYCFCRLYTWISSISMTMPPQ